MVFHHEKKGQEESLLPLGVHCAARIVFVPGAFVIFLLHGLHGDHDHGAVDDRPFGDQAHLVDSRPVLSIFQICR
jgi:hypothetical protein